MKKTIRILYFQLLVGFMVVSLVSNNAKAKSSAPPPLDYTFFEQYGQAHNDGLAYVLGDLQAAVASDSSLNNTQLHAIMKSSAEDFFATCSLIDDVSAASAISGEVFDEYAGCFVSSSTTLSPSIGKEPVCEEMSLESEINSLVVTSKQGELLGAILDILDADNFAEEHGDECDPSSLSCSESSIQSEVVDASDFAAIQADLFEIRDRADAEITNVEERYIIYTAVAVGIASAQYWQENNSEWSAIFDGGGPCFVPRWLWVVGADIVGGVLGAPTGPGIIGGAAGFSCVAFEVTSLFY